MVVHLEAVSEGKKNKQTKDKIPKLQKVINGRITMNTKKKKHPKQKLEALKPLLQIIQEDLALRHHMPCTP